MSRWYTYTNLNEIRIAITKCVGFLSFLSDIFENVNSNSNFVRTILVYHPESYGIPQFSYAIILKTWTLTYKQCQNIFYKVLWVPEISIGYFRKCKIQIQIL